MTLHLTAPSFRPRFVEEATGQNVRTFFSKVAHDPDLAVEGSCSSPRKRAAHLLETRADANR